MHNKSFAACVYGKINRSTRLTFWSWVTEMQKPQWLCPLRLFSFPPSKVKTMRHDCTCSVCDKQFTSQWKLMTCGSDECRETLGSTKEEQFFFDRVQKLENGCWQWIGGSDKKGNPVVNLGRGKCVAAWKYAMTIFLGREIRLERWTAGCVTENCVNPECRMNDVQRLESRLSPQSDGCIYWMAARDNDGYGIGWLNGRQGRITRLLWEKQNGPIPEGRQCLHTCDVPQCCNMDHLFIGSVMDNMQDKIKKGRATYLRGEEASWSKLNDDLVRSIFRMRADGVSIAEIHRRMIARGVELHPQSIANVYHGKTWSHVKWRKEDKSPA